MYFFAECRKKLKTCIHCIKIYSIVNVVFEIINFKYKENNIQKYTLLIICVYLMNLFVSIIVSIDNIFFILIKNTIIEYLKSEYLHFLLYISWTIKYKYIKIRIMQPPTKLVMCM